MSNQTTKTVYVIGHRNPDTDSICSAIGYSHFKNVTDRRFLFTPARTGPVNHEAAFILERFRVPMPIEMESLSATVSDLVLKRPVSVNGRDSIQSLTSEMRRMGVRAVPVVDDNRKLLGMVGLKDIADYYTDSVGFSDITDKPINIDILLKTLDGHVAANSGRAEYLSGKIHTAAMQKGPLLNRIASGDIVIIGDQHDIQLDLIRHGCSALIITDGIRIEHDVIAAAQAAGTVLISSPHPAFATVQLMTLSEPVLAIMSRNASTVGLHTTISELRQKVLESDYRSAVVVDSENRLIGFITRTDLLTPIRKKAILVDHNEISQAPDGIEEAEILEIIDHHRVGDISTVAPIYVYNDPIGSTCTVVANLMFLHQINIPSEIAGLLLSGILSDTLILTLSTTTEKDKTAAHRLAEIAGVSIMKYGKELLNESIKVKGKTPAELIAADFKESAIGGRRFGISQMMVLDCEEIDWIEKDLLAELDRIRTASGYDMTALLITNPLLASYERVLLSGETWIVEKAFGVKVEDGKCTLPRVMSRKKDFIPALGQALSMGR